MLTKFIFCSIFIVLCVGGIEISHAKRAVNLTDSNFDNHTVDSQYPWFVKFYAPWCGHCKRLTATWDELAEKYHGKAKFAKVDCTVETDLYNRFNIRGYPTLFLFDNGKYYKFKGERSTENLEAFVSGGFKELEGREIPKSPTFTERVTRELAYMFSSFLEAFDIIMEKVGLGGLPPIMKNLLIVAIFLFPAGLLVLVIKMSDGGYTEEEERYFKNKEQEEIANKNQAAQIKKQD